MTEEETPRDHRQKLVRAIAALDRERYHPEIYEDLKDE